MEAFGILSLRNRNKKNEREQRKKRENSMEWFLLLFNHMTDLNQSNEEQYFGNGQ